MTVAKGIFLPAGLENNSKLGVSFWTAFLSRTKCWNCTGEPNCERPAFWWLSLLCAIPVTLSELGIKGGLELVKVCLLCLLIPYRFIWSNPQPGKRHPRKWLLKYYSATSFINWFILTHRSCHSWNLSAAATYFE